MATVTFWTSAELFPQKPPTISSVSVVSLLFLRKRREYPNGYLYRLLRPELVRQWKTPLCSDAYSPFIGKLIPFIELGCSHHLNQQKMIRRKTNTMQV